MIERPLNNLGPAIAGAVCGFACVLAVVAYAVIDEVYVGCAGSVDAQTLGGRCHDLGYAVYMVREPLVAYGARAALAGALGGVALAAVFRFARRRRERAARTKA